MKFDGILQQVQRKEMRRLRQNPQDLYAIYIRARYAPAEASPDPHGALMIIVSQ
jgi:hypothetical protein